MTQQELEEWYEKDLADIKILYAESCAGWSWSSILVIFEKDGQLYAMDDTQDWSPYEIGQEDALKDMLEFEALLTNCDL